MVRASLLFLVLAFFILSAQAQTYKWVDAKGVVNYSNTPPPDAGNTVTVPDRISAYTPDPVTNNAVDVYRRLDAAQAEWLQRQYLMAMQQATPPAPAPDSRYAGTYFPAVAFFAAHRPHHVRQVFLAPTQPRALRQRASLNRF